MSLRIKFDLPMQQKFALGLQGGGPLWIFAYTMPLFQEVVAHLQGLR
jgi:hypothetical protein